MKQAPIITVYDYMRPYVGDDIAQRLSQEPGIQSQ